jgi:hypothetical protein
MVVFDKGSACRGFLVTADHIDTMRIMSNNQEKPAKAVQS